MGYSAKSFEEQGYKIHNVEITAADLVKKDEKLLLSMKFRSEPDVPPFCIDVGHDDKDFPYQFKGEHGASLVNALLEIVDVDRFSKLVGSYVRVCIKDGQIRVIGNIITEDWIFPYTILGKK